MPVVGMNVSGVELQLLSKQMAYLEALLCLCSEELHLVLPFGVAYVEEVHLDSLLRLVVMVRVWWESVCL